MSTDQIVFATRRDRISEGSQIVIVARFLDAGSALTPTNVKYRLDNLETGRELLDWTTASAGTTSTITIPGSLNDCHTRLPVEQIQVTVAADYALATQYLQTYVYEVRNSGWLAA